jgi:hypothetical protein
MKKSYRVSHSIENDQKNLCVDIIKHNNGGYAFQEWRREPEDLSGWFLMRDSGHEHFASEQDALSAAKSAVIWLSAQLS